MRRKRFCIDGGPNKRTEDRRPKTVTLLSSVSRLPSHFLTFCSIFFACLAFAQQNKTSSEYSRTIDSLSIILDNTGDDTTRIRILHQLSGALRDNDPEKAIDFAKRARTLAIKMNDKKAMAESIKYIGNVWLVRGEFSKSIEQYKEALQIQEKIQDLQGIASSLNNIGLAYRMTGQLDSALAIHSKCLTIDEQRKDTSGIAYSLGNIAAVYQIKGDFVKGLDFQFRCLKLLEELKDENAVGSCLANIATVYNKLGNLPSSMEYNQKALAMLEKTGNKVAVGHLLNNISNLLDEMKQYEKALEYLQRAIRIREELGDDHGLAVSYINLATLYSKMKKESQAMEYYLLAITLMEKTGDVNGKGVALAQIGNLYLESGKAEKAINNLEKAVEILKKIGNKTQLKDTYRSLAVCNELLSNFKNAYKYHQLYSDVKDTIFNEENSRQTTEMSAKYETEKKEKEILLQRSQIVTKEAENKKQQLFLLLIAAIALAIAVIAVVIFRSLGVTKRQKLVIEKQKHLVDEKNKHIEEKQKEIIDSITYAKRLQEAILPPVKLIKEYLPDSFILYKPKDIVAGDFFWMESCAKASDSDGEIVFIAAADCTGHGVPGAMVSVVCSNALNRAVKEFGLSDTGKILDKVTDLVLETFEKSSSDVKDGMDISLLAFNFSKVSNFEKIEVQWSGANNPLWYFAGNKFKEVKADKQPIGKYDNRKPFTTHRIECPPGSTFYLFTDGFPDQFGGPKGKKFKYKQLEEILLSGNNLLLNEQENLLDKAFRDWKGDLEQVDDVTVIGIRVG